MDRHGWEQPGAHEEAPGIYRIPLPLPGDHLKAVNVYAVADGEQLVLIDGGWAMGDVTDLLTTALGTLGYALADIREFLVTHIHRDHYTQAIAVRRLVGSSVSLGEGEQLSLEALRTIREHPDIKTMYAAGAFDLSAQLQKWSSSMGEGPDLTDWEDPDRWLPDGIDLPLTTRTLRVIATPGHTRGHVVYHDPQHDVLFAGDHVLPHITPSIGIELARKLSPLRDYLGSLQLMRTLPDARLLPAHGPVTASLHERVDELLVHHEQRLEATLKAVEGGAHTAFEVANVLTWTRRGRRFDELDMFNQIMAINETIAHLEVLRERDLVRPDPLEGVVHWTST
ncbi:MAG TPA: MBL fold metallo-hydrolase [Jatrophihabitantaceae bacterium]|nr:MBL fold metallo-hydrolase [Jatrophihabitantaceae bacterium]